MVVPLRIVSDDGRKRVRGRERERETVGRVLTVWLFGSVPFGCAVFCGRGEGYIIGGCYTASLVTRVTDVAATIYEDRFCPFFFHARSPYNGELGRKLWPLGPRSRPAILRNHRSRLSIQHRATYAFVRCIFMRLIIFFLFPFLLPLSRLHPRCSNLSLAGLWIHGRRDFRDRYPRRGSGIKASRSPRDCSLRLSFLRRYIGRTGFFVTTGELFAGRRDHLQTRPTRRTNDKKKGRTDSCRLTRGSLF